MQQMHLFNMTVCSNNPLSRVGLCNLEMAELHWDWNYWMSCLSKMSAALPPPFRCTSCWLVNDLLGLWCP